MTLRTKILVVSGLPCSGKTKLATRLRAELQWPLLSKDSFKELLFDSLGTGDREWSRRLSAAAYALMFAQAIEIMRSSGDSILEGNFRWAERAKDFSALQDAGADFVQMHCHAQPEILVARFRERTLSGRRHAGHVDSESLSEIENELRTAAQIPLPLGGMVLRCDTTNDWENAVERAVKEAKVLLSQPAL